MKFGQVTRAELLSFRSNTVDENLLYYLRRSQKRRKQQSKQVYISPIFIAMDYTELKENDRAFEWLGKAYDERSGWLLELKLDPVWDNLRTDSRFPDLLRRIGITP